MHRIILSIGTNFNRESNAKLVKGIISEAFHKVQFSEELLTEPVGDVLSDKKYLNFLACGFTEDEPEQIVAKTKQMETQCGNTEFLRNEGKIAMDIDLLKYNDQRFHESDWSRDYVKKLIKQFEVKNRYRLT